MTNEEMERIDQNCEEVWYECKDYPVCGFFGCDELYHRHRHMVRNHGFREKEFAIDMNYRSYGYKFPDERIK